MDRYVVGAVAGKPVDLVDDAVCDMVGLYVLDHPYQLGPVGLACGLARVDELLYDDRVEVTGFAQIRVTLGWDREALIAASALCLFLGGDAQIGDGERRGLAQAVKARRRCRRCQGHESCFLSPKVGASTTAKRHAVRLVIGNTTSSRKGRR
nr:hypothetical protein [Microbacterium sp.]